MVVLRYKDLSYNYISIGHDTRLLGQPYRPSKIELFSPAIQESCRGVIRGQIFSLPPSPAVYLALEKKHGLSAKNEKKNKKVGIFLHIFT